MYFTEVALDSNRAWCPKPGCNTICHICGSTNDLANTKARSVHCPKCEKEFCSSCSGNWHAGMTCQEYGKMLVKNHGAEQDTLLMIEGDIKRCPMCQVPIERDAGCAQMMCKRCKHVFCWFCLTSLDVSNTFSTIVLQKLHSNFRMIFYFDITTLGNVKGSWVTREPPYSGIARK